MKTRLAVIIGIMATGLMALAYHFVQPGNIGIAIATRNAAGPLQIVSVFPGSPAEGAGVRTNWFIISVNGTNVVSKSSYVCMHMLHGPVGTSVILELADPKMNQTNRFTITRADVEMDDVFRGLYGTNWTVSSRQSAPLTPEQAKIMATQLANEKAGAIYHSQPFQDGKPPSFIQGHWIWRDTRGYGRGDIQATVELAADGSTNHVDLQLLVSQNWLFQGGGGGRGQGF